MKFSRRQKNENGTLWSEDEVRKLISYIKNNDIVYNELQIAFPNRSLQAIRNKIRKIRISKSLFGASYQEEKQKYTQEISSLFNPKSVFEAYAGIGFQSLVWGKSATNVFSSERSKNKYDGFKNELFDNGYSEYIFKNRIWNRFSKNNKRIWFANCDAIKAATYVAIEHGSVDLIDLDTCGTSLPTLPIFLSILNPKYVVITHGEFHSLRFKREDVLRRILGHWDINKTILPMSNKQLSRELDKAVKIYALRSHNETKSSYWAELISERWLGPKGRGMLRRVYRISRPSSTADCLNALNND